MDKDTILTLANDAYHVANANGWYEQDIDTPTQLALILSEVGELINADRQPRDPNRPTVCTFDGKPFEYGTPDTEFTSWYKANIKGSVKEELADIVLRCFDCLRRQDKNIVWRNGYEYMNSRRMWIAALNSAPAIALAISQLLTDGQSLTVAVNVSRIIGMVISWCEHNNVDIQAHILWKLRYNRSRGHKHGNKRY